MVDQRSLRKQLLVQARKLGFTDSRRGGFSVKFLQDWIDEKLMVANSIISLISIRQRLKTQGASRKKIQEIARQISELEITKKSRGTPQRQVRYQRERRERQRRAS